MIIVTKRSKLTGTWNTMLVNTTHEKLKAYEVGDELIQDIMPNVNAAEREFLMSGITPKEWDDIFGEMEE